jgi:hypothetical protein
LNSTSRSIKYSQKIIIDISKKNIFCNRFFCYLASDSTPYQS